MAITHIIIGAIKLGCKELHKCGLEPDKMALMTSDGDAMRYPSIKWP